MGNSTTRFGFSIVALAAIGVGAFAGTGKATDLGLPPPVETWTGFSFGVGGGIAFMNTGVTSTKIRRSHEGVECPFTESVHFPDRNDISFEDFIGVPCAQPETTLFNVNHNFNSNFGDLDDTGGFFTVQAAYDYQFAPRWVVGAFVDADWSDLSVHARQGGLTASTTIPMPRSIFEPSLPVPIPGVLPPTEIVDRGTVDVLLSTDWSVSVGGRIGWLAGPGTLLYFLAAYTHQDLDDARLRVSFGDSLKNFQMCCFNPGDAPPFDNPFSSSSTDFVVKLPDSLDGFSLGGGGEVKLGGPWTLKGEYRWTHFDGGSVRTSSNQSETIQPDGQPIQCTAFPSGEADCVAPLRRRNTTTEAFADLDDVDIQTVRAVLTYHFWSGGGYGG